MGGGLGRTISASDSAPINFDVWINSTCAMFFQGGRTVRIFIFAGCIKKNNKESDHMIYTQTPKSICIKSNNETDEGKGSSKSKNEMLHEECSVK